MRRDCCNTTSRKRESFRSFAASAIALGDGEMELRSRSAPSALETIFCAITRMSWLRSGDLPRLAAWRKKDARSLPGSISGMPSKGINCIEGGGDARRAAEGRREKVRGIREARFYARMAPDSPKRFLGRTTASLTRHALHKRNGRSARKRFAREERTTQGYLL